MLIEESFTVKQDIHRVWDFLRDVRKSTACIPGCDGVEIVDERSFFVTVKAKVSYIPVSFRVKTAVEKESPPCLLVSSSKGDEAGKAGYLSQRNTLELKALPSGETEVVYRSEVSISGRLATFGQRVIRAKARELAEQFAGNIKARLEGVTDGRPDEGEKPTDRGIWRRLISRLRRLWRRLAGQGGGDGR